MCFQHFKRVRHAFVALCFILSFPIIAIADDKDATSEYNLDSLFNIAQNSGMPQDWKNVLQSAKEKKDTSSIGSAYIFYIQALNNMHNLSSENNDDIGREIKEAMDFLYSTKQRSYYFIAYNIYIDWLFANRAYETAQNEAANMYKLAMQVKHRLGGAIALRVQGQIFYKLGLYEKAFSALKEGLKVCPSYKTDLKTYSTAQSICEWLIMSCVDLKDYETAEFYTDFYGDMLEYWKKDGWDEHSGHYDVTYLSFKAMTKLFLGDKESAREYLKEAKKYIYPDFPANAYEHYYAANCMMLAYDHKYDEAIRHVDTLLKTHQYYYYPFYLRDLLVKAELLSRSGHSQESIELFKSYIRGNDSLLRAENIRQLDELRVKYQVERAEDAIHDKNMYLWLDSIIIILISLLLTLYIVYAKKLKANNRVIVSRLEEYDKRANSFMPYESNELLEDRRNKIPVSNHEIMERVELYMRETHPFKSPAFNRERLAKSVKVNDRLLTEAIKERTGLTTIEYINMCRLDYSRQLLSSNSELTVKEIADMCGFGTPRTFQRLFREKYGMPPSHYRKIIEGSDISTKSDATM